MAFEAHRNDIQRFVWLKVSFGLGEVFDPLLDTFVGEVHDWANIRERGDSREATRKALGVILGNLLRAHQTDPDLYVALSLSGGGYARGPDNPLGLGYRAIRRVVGYLTQGGLPALVELRGGGFNRDRDAGHTSRIRATRSLIGRLREHLTNQNNPVFDDPRCITNDTSIYGDLYNPLNSKLFIDHPLPIIRLKEGRRLIEYDSTPETEGMRDRLERFNEFLTLHWIDLLLPNDRLEGVLTEASEDDDAEGVRPDILFNRQLYRVFNNKDFEQGGRFYGGWWINIPSRYRRFITINWSPTVELDFSNMQAAMLYAMEGRTLEGDAYEIEGIDPGQFRKLVKLTFFKLINAEGRMRAPKRAELPDGWTWAQLLQAVRDKHQPIERHFNSGIGIRLQRWDADIAETVMISLMEDDTLVLPIHDSFICTRPERLREGMRDAYLEQMGREIGIEADPSFIETELPPEAIEMDALGVYNLEDAIRDREDRPEYFQYRQRRAAFLAEKDEAWGHRFYGA